MVMVHVREDQVIDGERFDIQIAQVAECRPAGVHENVVVDQEAGRIVIGWWDG
jgi:hypothetical protein